MSVFFVCFFKQKTAYDMRMSDWSSDVCSSDLERRLGNVEMAALDQLRHLPEEEGEQERADVAAVHIGVGHDDDLVVAQLIDVELVATDAGAERRYQSTDLLRRQHLVEARPPDIQDFAAQQLGGASGRKEE